VAFEVPRRRVAEREGEQACRLRHTQPLEGPAFTVAVHLLSVPDLEESPRHTGCARVGHPGAEPRKAQPCGSGSSRLPVTGHLLKGSATALRVIGPTLYDDRRTNEDRQTCLRWS
jgi:hypothetical protein